MKTQITTRGWKLAAVCALAVMTLPLAAAEKGLRPDTRIAVPIDSPTSMGYSKIGLRESVVAKTEKEVTPMTTVSGKAIPSRFEKVGLREWSTRR